MQHNQRDDNQIDQLASSLALAQGLYVAVTGVWPIVHMRSFLAVTGPKRDLWLVNTVGAVLTAVGGTLALAGLRRRPSLETGVLGVGSAAALAGIDLYYVSRRAIPSTYLLDAGAEAAFIAAWAALGIVREARR